MTPAELTTYLTTLTARRLPLSVMIWGAPGIGKSSIVAQVAQAHGLPCIDLRLSQLAPPRPTCPPPCAASCSTASAT